MNTKILIVATAFTIALAAASQSAKAQSYNVDRLDDAARAATDLAIIHDYNQRVIKEHQQAVQEAAQRKAEEQRALNEAFNQRHTSTSDTMDDDGRLAEYLKYYGYDASPINIDKLRAAM